MRTHRGQIFFILVVLQMVCLLNLNFVHAETIVKTRIKALNQLAPIKKITVGPQDQYQGVVDSSEAVLIFTHKESLAPHLFLQNISTGAVFSLLDKTADSQEPALSQNDDLAFTYYKKNSRGDICFLKNVGRIKAMVPDSEIQCLKRSTEDKMLERLNPFWINSSEIGYIEQEMQSPHRKIIAENIDSGAKRIIYQGAVWSPQISLSGRYLTFNEIQTSEKAPKRHILILDLKSQHKFQLAFDLPGISAFPQFSVDEKYLYFSQYLNDTNFDNLIDGSDNAVIFRAPLDQLMTEKPFAQQLTSVEKNCNFPKPAKNNIYLTCDFEGSLDIYSIPLDGAVPTTWDLPLLENALLTSRSYQERVLILNNIKYRFGNDRNFDELFFSNHLLSEDTSAAQYYLEKMKPHTQPPSTTSLSPEFFELLSDHLEIKKIKKKLQSQIEISQDLRAQIQTIESRISKVHIEVPLQQLLRAELALLKKNAKKAWGILSKIKFSRETQPIERFIYFEAAFEAAHETAHETDVEAAKTKSSNQEILQIFNQALDVPELSEQAQIYYGVYFLAELEKQFADFSTRASYLEKIQKKSLSPSIAKLLRAESLGIKIILAADKQKKEASYKELDQILIETRNNYDLKKAIYVRTILNFNKAQEFDFLNLIATNWLRYTQQNDTEFLYAREVFSDSSNTQAYSSLSKQELGFAESFFYQSLSLTDDLESHYGYINTMVRDNKRAVLKERYQNLEKRQFIDDNLKFIEALLLLLDEGALEKSTLKQATEKLESMTVDRDSPVRYLLMGYCELHQFLSTANGLDLDQELLKRTHHDLMLAYDLGRDNARIKAAALINLGLLHLRAGNAGLSARFFLERKKLGFTSELQKINFTWSYSRALFLSNQSDIAAQEITSLDHQLLPTPFLEREAFYLIAAQKYKEALPILESLIKNTTIKWDSFGRASNSRNNGQGAINQSRLFVNFGLALLRSGRGKEAKIALQQAQQWVSLTRPQNADSEHLIEYRPERLELIISGLLAQTGEKGGPEEIEQKIVALQKRGHLFATTKPLLEEWSELEIKNDLQLAYAQKEQHPELALKSIEHAVLKALDFAKNNSSLSQPVLETTYAYLAFGISNPQIFRSSQTAELVTQFKELNDSLNESFYKQKIISPFLKYQQIKLQILSVAFNAKVSKNSLAEKTEFDKILNSEDSEIIKKDLPNKWAELNQYQFLFSIK